MKPAHYFTKGLEANNLPGQSWSRIRENKYSLPPLCVDPQLKSYIYIRKKSTFSSSDFMCILSV